MRVGVALSGARWMVGIAIALHVLWGVILLFSAAPLGATPVHVYAGLPHALAGLLFLFVAAVAALGVLRLPSGWPEVLALLPQQAVLSVSAYGALQAIVVKHYGDGVVRPRLFILADQSPAILVMLLHTAAILAIAAGGAAQTDLRRSLDEARAETERLRRTLAQQAAALGLGDQEPPVKSGD